MQRVLGPTNLPENSLPQKESQATKKIISRNITFLLGKHSIIYGWVIMEIKMLNNGYDCNWKSWELINYPIKVCGNSLRNIKATLVVISYPKWNLLSIVTHFLEILYKSNATISLLIVNYKAHCILQKMLYNIICVYEISDLILALHTYYVG